MCDKCRGLITNPLSVSPIMQRLFLKQSLPSHNHLTTDTPPNHHRHAFTHCATLPPPLQPALRLSCNALFKPKVMCNVFTDHGEFRSTTVEFRRRNSLFNKSLNYQKTWQLHSTRGLAPANCAVKGLIFASVVVFLLGKVADKEFMDQNFTLQPDNFYSGRYHTLITSSFSHTDVKHIISNMLALYFHGNRVGQRVGSKFLVKLYFVGGFVGSVSFLAHRAFLARSSKVQHPNTIMNQMCEEPDHSKVAALGASDAVKAIMMLDILLTSVDISLFNFTIPLNVLSVGRFIWKDIKRVKDDGEYSGVAHLGGSAVGIIAWAWLRMGRM